MMIILFSSSQIILHFLFLLFIIPCISSHCPCILFNQTGTFHSPDYPKVLQPTTCLIYHFQAPPRHIVRLTFESFILPPSAGGRCESRVSLYERVEDGLIDPFTDTPDAIFCSRQITAGSPLYSITSHFLMVLHTEQPSKGFIGKVDFIPRANMTMDAGQTAECAFRVDKLKGRILSPRYPYHPSPNSNCSYLFPFHEGYSLTLQSTYLNMAPQSVIQVYEIHHGQKTIIDRFTRQSDSLLLSTQHTLLLLFFSGTENIRNSGFEITYTYEKSAKERLIQPDSIADCSLQILSSKGQNGTISSNTLPSQKSSLPSKCLIIFQGEQNEKVSVWFTYFNLYAPDKVNTTKRCNDLDQLSAAVRVGSRFSRIDSWCGSDMPPKLMSGTNTLQIEYTTKSSRAVRDSAPEEIGFTLNYKFHTDWDMEKMDAIYDASKGCRFIFNSSRRESGKLWSVNYPGLYPRNLHCEYIFHGKEDQTVYIHFEYFDVEGFHQCDEQSQSDFVLFSNYQSPDRNNRRVCGKTPPRIATISESNYYRMVFSTNEIFDATGFFAHYQFIGPQKAQIARVKFTPNSATDKVNNFLNYFLIFVLFTYLSL